MKVNGCLLYYENSTYKVFSVFIFHKSSPFTCLIKTKYSFNHVSADAIFIFTEMPYFDWNQQCMILLKHTVYILICILTHLLEHKLWITVLTSKYNQNMNTRWQMMYITANATNTSRSSSIMNLENNQARICRCSTPNKTGSLEGLFMYLSLLTFSSKE